MPITFSYSAFAKAVLTIAFLFFFQSLLAHSISSFITDQNGQPLKDVYVLHLEAGDHTHANYKGNYTIDNTQKGDELRFSYIGYEAGSLIIIDVKKILEIILNPSPLSLDEITISNDVETLHVLANVDLQSIQ
jgi:hypothetical protein